MDQHGAADDEVFPVACQIILAQYQSPLAYY